VSSLENKAYRSRLKSSGTFNVRKRRPFQKASAMNRQTRRHQVASEMPLRRHNSGTLAPASAQYRKPMIFSSVNRDFFIGLLPGGKLYFRPVRHFEGATAVLEIEIAGLAEHERDPVGHARAILRRDDVACGREHTFGRDENRERRLFAERVGLLRALGNRSKQGGQGAVEQGLPAVVVDMTVRIDLTKLVQPLAHDSAKGRIASEDDRCPGLPVGGIFDVGSSDIV
jgi:hypothetical protein